MLPLTVLSDRLKFNPHLECFIADMSSLAENFAMVSTAPFLLTFLKSGVWSATVRPSGQFSGR